MTPLRQGLAVLLLLAPGCAHVSPVSPPPPRPFDAKEACAYDDSLTVTRASGGASIGGGGSITIGTASNAWQPVYNATPTAAISGGGSGFAVYRGEELLEMDQVLGVLNDPELTRYHERSLEPHSSGDFVYWARPTWITLLVGGMALAGAGAAVGLSAEADPVTGATDLGAMLPLAGAGLGAMVGSIPFVFLDLGNVDSYGELFTRRKVWIGDQAANARFDAAIQRHNEAVQRSCDR
jgi:hypothetical protein